MAASDFIPPPLAEHQRRHNGQTASAAREAPLFNLLDLSRVTYAKHLGYYRY